MDLHSMLNDGPPPEKKKSSHSSPPPATPIGRPLGSSSASANTPHTSHASHASHHHGSHSSSAGSLPPPLRPDQPPTPIYGPPADHRPRSQPQSRGLSPLLTPHQMSENGQYPFPQQPLGPQYRPPHSATTATPSHGYPFTQPSPGAGPYTYPQMPSHSPTPVSQHSHTPHSTTRQSPLAHMSQKRTPLGPPAEIPRYTESRGSRDRSLSVSPKTIPPAPSEQPRLVALPATIPGPVASSDPSLSTRVSSSEKMGMSHLLGPATHASPPAQNNSPHPPTPQRERIAASVKSETATTIQNNITKMADGDSTPSHKRKAESELTGADSKRPRQRAKTRPIWARLSQHNPRSKIPGITPNGPPVAQQSNGAPRAQLNGHTTESRDPLIDHQLIRVRQRMENDAKCALWERSMAGTTALSSLLKRVTDWLFYHLKACDDIGHNSNEATIEIEAKIGTLEDANTRNRFQSPLQGIMAVDPGWAHRNLQFRSEMVDIEHKHMNQFLNKVVQESTADPKRASVTYKHLRETDSFRPLTEAGANALPPAALRHHTRGLRDLKLRTTIDNMTGQVTARIVKIKVADLHIFNSDQPYDMRISINIECNMDKYRPELISQDPTPQNLAPDRKKDRMAYHHLCYETDLTRVDQEGQVTKYELELEVDAKKLTGEMVAMQGGDPNHAFTDIVEVFLENAQCLMRQRRA